MLSGTKAIVVPLTVVGMALLVFDMVLFATGGARSAGWHYACAAQPFMGALGLGLGALLAALVIINVIICILLGVLLFVLFLAILALFIT